MLVTPSLKRELQINDYNFYADLLNKYSQLTPWVQALLGIEFFAAVLGVAYFIKETVASIAHPLRQDAAAKPKQEWRDKYYRDDDAPFLHILSTEHGYFRVNHKPGISRELLLSLRHRIL